MFNSHKIFQMVSLALVALVLTSCASTPEEIQPEFEPTYLTLDTGKGNTNGAIFNAGTERSLFEDMKARRIGDILTIMLVEQTSGQNSSDNSVNKTTNMNVAVPTAGGRTFPNLAAEMNAANTFSGESGSSQSNKLSGSIAVTVTGVLPNGNLIIEGEKWIRINQGNEYIRLQGVIRQRDIDPYNSLLSTQVADAHISYGGTGTNAQSSDPGWAAKILFSPLWPF